MDPSSTKRVELVLPMRTVLIVAAAIGVAAAFAAIGDTFLVVFVGIFLALVFEFPVRFVMAKTNMSRGLAATVTVLGTAVAVTVLALLLLVPLVGAVRDFLQELPTTVQQLQDSDELSWLGDSGAAGNVQEGAQQISSLVPDAISAVLGIAGGFFSLFLAAFTILFICLFLLTDIANLKRALGSVLMPGEDERWLSVWERVTESVSRWAIGLIIIATIAGTTQGVTAWLLGSSYADRAGCDRGAARHDPQPRRHDRRVHPRADALGRAGPHRRADHGRRRADLPAAREQHPHTEDPGQGGEHLALLHHRLRDALRRPARRARRAHRRPAGGDDPDPRAGADEGAAREGGSGEGGRRARPPPEQRPGPEAAAHDVARRPPDPGLPSAGGRRGRAVLSLQRAVSA